MYTLKGDIPLKVPLESLVATQLINGQLEGLPQLFQNDFSCSLILPKIGLLHQQGLGLKALRECPPKMARSLEARQDNDFQKFHPLVVRLSDSNVCKVGLASMRMAEFQTSDLGELKDSEWWQSVQHLGAACSVKTVADERLESFFNSADVWTMCEAPKFISKGFTQEVHDRGPLGVVRRELFRLLGMKHHPGRKRVSSPSTSSAR